MAILILQEPDKLNPVYNGVYYTINSNQIGQNNYKFGVNVFEKPFGLNDFSKITELFYLPTPTQLASNTTVNVGSILDVFISTDVPVIDQITNVTGNRNNVRDFYVEFKGYSGITSTVFETVTGSTFQYFNGVILADDYPDYNPTDYIFTTGGTQSRFLTNKPTTLCNEDYNWLYFYVSGNTTTELDVRSLTPYDEWENITLALEPYEWTYTTGGIYEITHTSSTG